MPVCRYIVFPSVCTFPICAQLCCCPAATNNFSVATALVPPMWANQQPPPDVVQTVASSSTAESTASPRPSLPGHSPKTTSGRKIFNGNRKLILSGHGQLVISPVDQGHYQCEASNGVGNDISAITALHAHSPPPVQLLNGNSAAVRRSSRYRGSSTTLRCP